MASATKAQRGERAPDPGWTYAISLGFAFNPAAHGHQPLDIENFMKPTLDALAAGLFCGDLQDPASIRRYAFDDSNFKYLFAHRLPDAPTIETEGVAIVASIRRAM